MFRAKILPETSFVQKVAICENYIRFNHRAVNCRGKKRCEKCTVQHEHAEQFKSCENEAKCAFCKSSTHTSNFDKCPEKLRQLNIKRLMAKRTVTYAEASEQLPTTSNIYEPLNNLEEFPMLPDSFTAVVQNPTMKNLRQQWAQTNQERNRIVPAVKLFMDKDDKTKPGVKRSRTDNQNKEMNSIKDKINNDDGKALNNPFKVSDKERWEHIMKEEKRKAEMAASQSMNIAMMTFYTEFINQLEDAEEIKRKFKICTEKHFKLSNTVVNEISN